MTISSSTRNMLTVLLAILAGGTVLAQTTEGASEENPVDFTSYITNPSFETNGTTGWTVNNMATQSNAVFSQKQGTYYVETWVNMGQKIGEASVEQTLKNLPRGNYQLKANALHIQQARSQSTQNSGAAQKGAFLFAGNAKVEVATMRQYTVKFSVLEEKANVNIGLKTESPTGNYLCVDNFLLSCIGDINADSYVSEIALQIEYAHTLLNKPMQTAVAEALREAVDIAENAIVKPTDGDSAPVDDIEKLAAAYDQLAKALKNAEASCALYDNLQVRIDYAEKVIGWWKDLESKATAVGNLTSGIADAKEKMADFTLTDAQLKAAVTVLNTRISTVDKKIYCSYNACGTDAQLKNANNQWCYDRSLQSKHWILFWEKGYGTGVPAAVEGILNTADKIFEFYADSLKFIKINQGKSKTDTYKMIIRLRHTTDWEASGSGIDNQIGLLTLSNGAHTSRSGQTVAHEIGHCFQYQTHCDNNNQNGWMYNWGTSAYNVFWEMCAQWQAYKYYPSMQFNNEWFTNTINGFHRHPLAVHLRYNNYFIQDFLCHKHGMDIIGRLWNESKSPEDPFQAYMRLTMTGTTAQKLSQLGDEMWEYGARLTTFDMDPIRTQGKSSINKRTQPTFTNAGDGFWRPTAAYCIENWGNNAIRLNVPSTAKTVYVDFVGEAGKSGYTAYRKVSAGWRYGFVAYLKDGSRVYGDINRATYNDSIGFASFDCPANCQYLWLVVSGAPTSYWTRDWPDWEGESTAEQWPYRIKFYQTNIYGKTNNNTYPTGIKDVRIVNRESLKSNSDIYDLQGRKISSSDHSSLKSGLYLVGGKKIFVK